MLPQAPDTWTLFEAAHLLNRAGFGGNPDEIKALHALGRSKAVDSLLNPTEPIGAIPMPAWANREQAIEDMRERGKQFIETQRATKGMTAEEAARFRQQSQKAEQIENRQRGIEGQGWWFRAMLATKAPLREKMTLFWHDHFATSIQKVKLPALMMIQNDLFRRNALGNFRTLTHEIAKDPAMMFYLDTQSSKKGKPNENFAREVMELFTLGEGNYSEQDIREAARAFTGYQLNRMNGTVEHFERQWDEGDKTVFGKTGKFDGDDVINLIFEQPQAAKLMAGKLWEYFAAEDPPTAAVEALADSFREAKYEITPLLREIFLSKEFYAAEVMRNQVKSPIQYLLQLLKQLDLQEAPQGYTQVAQQQLGQVLFMPPNVAGWDWGKAWINTSTLLTRYNIAGFITKGAQDAPALVANNDAAMMQEGEMMEENAPKQAQRPLLKKNPNEGQMANGMALAARFWKGPDYDKVVPRELRNRHADLIDTLGFRFFQAPLPEAHRKRFLAFAEEKAGVVFTNHEIAELIHLMLSTPDYQLC
jgi:uncharacterized protein (DUF1800 family)